MEWLYTLDMKWQISLGFIIFIELVFLIRILIMNIRVTLHERDRKIYMFYVGILTLYTPLCLIAIAILSYIHLTDGGL